MTSLSWQPTTLAWAAAACAGLAVVHAIISYRRVGPTDSPARWIAGLALLRIAALLLVVVAAFQPTLQYTDRSERRRPVIVMIDDSQSMGVVDPSRSKAQLVRLASALGKIDPSLRDRPASAVLDALQRVRSSWPMLQELSRLHEEARVSGGDLAGTRQQYASLAGEMATLLTDAATVCATESTLRQSANALRGAAESIADPSRLARTRQAVEAARNEIQRADDHADERLASTEAIKPVVTALAALSRIGLAREITAPLAASLGTAGELSIASLEDSEISLQSLKADRPASPLLQSLRETLERGSGRQVEAIILLSDGRSTELQQVIPPLVTAAGVPVFTVPLAPTDRSPDVRIADIDVPPSALRGETIAVAVQLRYRQAEGKRVELSLTDGKQTETRTVTLGAGSRQVERFSWKNASPPTVELRATVEPLAGEIQHQNNAKAVSVPVVDQKLRVTLISGAAHWDLQYLRNILSRTPWIELSDQLLAPGEACRFEATELARQDVFILCDLPAAAMSAQQIDAIHRSVTEQSKSALLLAGDAALWQAMARQPLLAAFVPQRVDQVSSWRQTPAEDPSILAVPARDAGFLSPVASQEESADALRRWLSRPQLFRVMSVGQLKPATRVLLQDRSTQIPVMVETVVGTGRSMAILTTETWRWRRDIGGEAHDRFWLDTIRHLMEPPYADTRGGLSLGVDRTTIVSGDVLGIRARRPVAFSAPISVELRREGQVVETLTPNETLPGSGRLGAQVSPARPGAYEVRLVSGDLALSTNVLVMPHSEAEMADTAPDLGLLTRIAESTGGAVVPLDQALSLPERIARSRGDRNDTIIQAIWCSPYVFCAIVGLLGLEWAIRKQLGLI